MARAGFPRDEYTPHGYLANPFAVAHSWSEGEGGCLRTSRDYVGMGWQLPWALRAQASVDLVVSLECGNERLITRADFDAASLTSPHHSANLFIYSWEAFGQAWKASFTLIDADQLGVEVAWSPLYEAPLEQTGNPVRLTIGLVGWRSGEVGPSLIETSPPSAPDLSQPYAIVDLGEPFGTFRLAGDNIWIERPDGYQEPTRVPGSRPAPWLANIGGRVAVALAFDLHPAEGARVCAIARRIRPDEVPPVSASVTQVVGAAIGRARSRDDEFWSGTTRLEGDWPTSWRRGWVYDTETTRMCVYPPGGIFKDVWPAWMIQWPRAVIAENTLDMARFAYASPDLAQRALLSLFRDAEAPNIPCVFQHGEPNMVARDGSNCGTSPAWCVPFYNLERLFSFTLDRGWLAQIYPFLRAYLDWWLAERTDADGWAVYKCTWEAGEDDTPRLDPERRGDNVVSAFVRPVELQATMALSASVMKRFSTVLGGDADYEHWHDVEQAFLQRTGMLWDPEERRFRDWDSRNGQFLAPAPEQPNYWDIDPCRFSALAFTPLLAGLTDEEYLRGLRAELQHYDGPPWTLWASWSYVVLEAARFAGVDDIVELFSGRAKFAARVASSIVGRVYGELDARQIADPRHPTPGVAREYWPLDLDTWASCEGYGWGANTASLLVRQIFGFVEGPYLDEVDGAVQLPVAEDSARESGWRASSLAFELRPGLPEEFLVPGREYWLSHLPYRGAQLSIGYRVDDPGENGQGHSGALTFLVEANVPTQLRVDEARTGSVQAQEDVVVRHAFSGKNGQVYVVKLEAAI